MTGGRCEEDLNIPFGAVVRNSDGTERWVFVGWYTTTVGRGVVMVREMQPGEVLNEGHPYMYHCAMTDTLLRRFPGLLMYARPDSEYREKMTAIRAQQKERQQ